MMTTYLSAFSSNSYGHPSEPGTMSGGMQAQVTISYSLLCVTYLTYVICEDDDDVGLLETPRPCHQCQQCEQEPHHTVTAHPPHRGPGPWTPASASVPLPGNLKCPQI